jgi:hypothetical protein
VLISFAFVLYTLYSVYILVAYKYIMKQEFREGPPEL